MLQNGATKRRFEKLTSDKNIFIYTTILINYSNGLSIPTTFNNKFHQIILEKQK